MPVAVGVVVVDGVDGEFEVAAVPAAVLWALGEVVPVCLRDVGLRDVGLIITGAIVEQCEQEGDANTDADVRPYGKICERGRLVVGGRGGRVGCRCKVDVRRLCWPAGVGEDGW